jgi:hypothetical protein
MRTLPTIEVTNVDSACIYWGTDESAAKDVILALLGGEGGRFGAVTVWVVDEYGDRLHVVKAATARLAQWARIDWVFETGR